MIQSINNILTINYQVAVDKTKQGSGRLPLRLLLITLVADGIQQPQQTNFYIYLVTDQHNFEELLVKIKLS